jgi:Flp pilus assembly protein TadG
MMAVGKRGLRNLADRIRRRSRFAGDCRGVTAVEFALVAPVLALMLFEIFELGWIIHSRSELAFSADRAARLVYLDPSTTETALASEIVADLATVDGGDLTVNIATAIENGVTYREITLSYPYTMSGPVGHGHQLTLSVMKRTPAIVGS